MVRAWGKCGMKDGVGCGLSGCRASVVAVTGCELWVADGNSRGLKRVPYLKVQILTLTDKVS